MNELDKNGQADAPPSLRTEQVDATRRRLTRGGAAGAGVLLSVASRSAFGTSTWGTCTGSELASGNLSREGTPRPCGCSPGYWGNDNGTRTWMDHDLPLVADYPQTALFNTVFGVNFFKPSDPVTLKDAIDMSKNPWTIDKGGWCPPRQPNKVGSMKTVAFHAVAALLNAHLYGPRYPVIGMQSAQGVISAFQTAFSLVSNGNVSSLEAFGAKVDVYDSQGTWCMGSEHTL